MTWKNRNWIYFLIVIGLVIILVNGCKKEGNNTIMPPATVTDVDGNVYHTVTIGTQVWLVENLKTTKYRDGTPIPNVLSNSDWCNLTSGAYCNYNNTSNLDTINTYGRLYNGYAVGDNRNLAPAGWHIPTLNEWVTLITFLGSSDIGGKAKETGTIHWSSPNVDATNQSGFTALPAGYRGSNVDFSRISYNCYFWSSTDTGPGSLWYTALHYNGDDFDKENINNFFGFSVRCIMD